MRAERLTTASYPIGLLGGRLLGEERRKADSETSCNERDFGSPTAATIASTTR